MIPMQYPVSLRAARECSVPPFVIAEQYRTGLKEARTGPKSTPECFFVIPLQYPVSLGAARECSVHPFGIAEQYRAGLKEARAGPKSIPEGLSVTLRRYPVSLVGRCTWISERPF